MLTRATPSPPPVGTMLGELRAPLELAALISLVPLLRLLPCGDGHPVMVLPGLAADDASTLPLRAFLKDRGYSAHGWRLGVNRGLRVGVEAAMQDRLAALADRFGRKVSLIGWSMGGIFARELARQSPERVRSVITLGSPFAAEPRSGNAWRLYETLSEQSVEDWPGREAAKLPPPVPSTAIYSRSDGIVAWQGCLEREGPGSENIEVESSHCGLGHNPAVLYAIADRLAIPEGQWWPFDRGALGRSVYPDPHQVAAEFA